MKRAADGTFTLDVNVAAEPKVSTQAPEQTARRLLERQERGDLRRALEESHREAVRQGIVSSAAGADADLQAASSRDALPSQSDIVERPVAAHGDDDDALQWALRESERMQEAELQWALFASAANKDAGDTSGTKVEAQSKQAESAGKESDSKEPDRPRKPGAAGLERFPPSTFRNLRMDKGMHQNKVMHRALAVKSEGKIAKSIQQPAEPMNGGVPKSPAAAAAEARLAQLQRRGRPRDLMAGLP